MCMCFINYFEFMIHFLFIFAIFVLLYTLLDLVCYVFYTTGGEAIYITLT